MDIIINKPKFQLSAFAASTNTFNYQSVRLSLYIDEEFNPC